MQIVEECYFLWKAINLFRNNGSLYLFNVKQADVEGKRRCLEEICLETWKLICKLPNKWIHHSCEVPGCSEGYIRVDGLEKVSRTMCAAPTVRRKFKQARKNAILLNVAPIRPLLEGNRKKRLNTAGNIYILKKRTARWIVRKAATT